MMEGENIMKSLRISSIVLFVAIVGIYSPSALFAPQAFGETFPSKPIQLYIGIESGGSTDPWCRALADGVEKILGQPVVVENKGGGFSSVCASLVSNKKPDGYTLGIIFTPAITTLPYTLSVPYDPWKDFTYLGQFTNNAGGILVHPDSPIKTIEEFIDYAKKHPGMSYGTGGVNSPSHLVMEEFSRHFNLKFRHVPYSGGGKAATDLIGKHLDFAMGAGIHKKYVKEGVLRMLIIANSDQRDPDFPNIRLMKDIGVTDVPGLGGLLVGPKNMPPEIAKKLEDAFAKSSKSEAFQKILSNIYLPYKYKSRAQLEKDLPAESAFMKDLLAKSGGKKN